MKDTVYNRLRFFETFMPPNSRVRFLELVTEAERVAGLNASESPLPDGGEEAHERGYLFGDASESGQPPEASE